MLRSDMATLYSPPEPTSERLLPIGCFAAIGRNRLAMELLRFGELCPDVAVGVHEMGRPALLSGLRSGELALAVLPGEPDPEFRHARLWDDRALLALPPGHPLATEPAVAVAELAQLLFLVSRKQHGNELHRFLLRRLLGEGARVPSEIRDLGLGKILGLVTEGAGAALVCESQIDPARNTVALRPIDHPAARFTVHAQWAGGGSDPVLARLIDLLVEESLRFDMEASIT
jgi:DNA-binding transcriptional LysR family regulator